MEFRQNLGLTYQMLVASPDKFASWVEHVRSGVRTMSRQLNQVGSKVRTS